MSAVKQWQSIMAGAVGGGWLDYVTAHVAFDSQIGPASWPEGSYWDLSEGAYYIPV
jgi:hypothetical protein